VQRKALTPNDFGRSAFTERLLAVQEHDAEIARSFEWSLARADLERVIERIAEHKPHEPQLELAA
jgi:hypothetical protein